MTQKVAIAIIHGIGQQEPTFADKMSRLLKSGFAKSPGHPPAADLVIHPVYWAPVLQSQEDKLRDKFRHLRKLHFKDLRRFLINYGGDIFAYQPVPEHRRIYDAVHEIFAKTLRRLATEAGETAPLCIIAHSLGTVIASNYIYDLQKDHPPQKDLIGQRVREVMGAEPSPLEKGETLALFYTLGSPLAVFNLRYENFDNPITFPAPRLAEHHPHLKSEWLNFYDIDDAIGFPLKVLSDSYDAVVKEDVAVNVGSPLESWSPLLHTGYWSNKDVAGRIVEGLARTWHKLNP
jgi:hypothetical protein